MTRRGVDQRFASAGWRRTAGSLHAVMAAARRLRARWLVRAWLWGELRHLARRIERFFE